MIKTPMLSNTFKLMHAFDEIYEADLDYFGFSFILGKIALRR
jgi:hypothetical protein